MTKAARFIPLRATLAGLLAAAVVLAVVQAAPAQRSSAVTVWATGDGVRVNPETNKYMLDRQDIHKEYPTGDYQARNAVWDSAKGTVKVYGARNEFVAFQVIVDRGAAPARPLRGVKVELASLTGPDGKKLAGRNVALYQAYCMNVKKPSNGYEKTSLGPGWYPDPLVAAETGGPLTFDIPNPRNHIGNTQRNQSVWVDIFIPKDRREAPPGIYKGTVAVSWAGGSKRLAVELKVWDFQLPDEIHCRGDIWNGSLRDMSPEVEMRYYQIAHRHRIHPGVAGYKPKVRLTVPPGLTIPNTVKAVVVPGLKTPKVEIDWTEYDRRLAKYFNGEAFTAKHGYWGPGYGYPIPHIQLPFNCNKPDQNGRGWPVSMPLLPEGESIQLNPEHIGKREPKHGPFAFRNKPTPVFEAIWLDTARQFKEHFEADPTWSKTRRIVFLGALDESHRSLKARELMIYYSKLLRKAMGKDWFSFRIDGGYNSPYMRPLAPYVGLWVCHTAGWHQPKMINFRGKGVETWFYGPMVYEQQKNSGCGSNTFTDLDLNVNRGIGWGAWKQRSGYCEWEFDAYIVRSPREHRPTKPFDPRWFAARNCRYGNPRALKEYNGSGLLIFRGLMVGRPGQPIPTVRLKSHRRGMQDYEYFWLLKQAGMGDKADEIVDSIVHTMPFGGENYRNPNIWRHNPEQWEAARIKAGELLNARAAR